MQVEDAEAEQGLELVYRDHGARLWRAVFAFAGDRQIADDAVAEAFAQALRRGRELRDPLAWIWRVAFRVAAGELKDRHVRQAAFVDVPYEMPEPAWEIMRFPLDCRTDGRICEPRWRVARAAYPSIAYADENVVIATSRSSGGGPRRGGDGPHV